MKWLLHCDKSMITVFQVFFCNPLGSRVFPILTPDHSLLQRFLIKRKTPWRIRGGLAPETIPGCADSDNHVQLGAVLPTFDREVRGPGGATRGCINDWMQKRHQMQMFHEESKIEVFGIICVICFHSESLCIPGVVRNVNWPNHNYNINLSMLTSTGRSKLSGSKRERPAMKVKTMRVTTPSLRTAWAENLGMCEGLKCRKQRHLNKIWTNSFRWEKPLSWCEPSSHKINMRQESSNLQESVIISAAPSDAEEAKRG